MKILLTGGAGYIGSHTAVELDKAGHEIVIVDNLVNSKEEAVRRVEEIIGKSVPFVKADVRDRESMDSIFKTYNIDAVIHFAGLKAVGESVSQPLRYYRNNLDSTLTLCEVMQAHGCKKIVFSSSATVYGNQPEVPYREDMVSVGCTNPYGWTKYMSEQIMRDTAKADKEWAVVFLRYFNPIGAHPSGLIGEDPRGIPNNLMPFISQVAVGRRDHLNVFGDDYATPDGTGVRDYIHVVDLARGHVAAIDHMRRQRGESVFNLGTGKGCSVLELVHAFEKVNGVKIPYEIVPRRAGDLATVYASTDKSAEILGWKAEYSIEDMCRDSWNWQSRNPMGYNG